MRQSILVAGVGNIFLGDDGFGVEVVRFLMDRGLPNDVLIKDFGIRGFDLAYALLDPWDTVILVDALARGGIPGTLYKMEPDIAGLGAMPQSAMNPHGMDPVRVLQLAASMGTIAARILVVGCEPKDFGDEFEGRMGLSAPVKATIPGAAKMIEHLVHDCLRDHVRPTFTNEEASSSVPESREVTL